MGVKLARKDGQATRRAGRKRAADGAATPGVLALRPLRGGPVVPLWLQLKHALRDLVSFDLQPGDRIPTEAEIGAHYDLSRITVRQAVTSLVEEGLLHRQQGRGTFVRARRQDTPLSDPAHFLATAFDRAAQAEVTTHAAETVPCPDWVASRLGIAAGAPVHKLRRLLRREGATVAIRTSFVPEALAPDLLDAPLDGPMHLLLERLFGLYAQEAQERLEVIGADAWRAGLLGVSEHAPLVLTERVAYDAAGRALECARTYYRADAFSFTRTLRRGELRSLRPRG
jgi:DNA-binding GntR family transcriptional regulator